MIASLETKEQKGCTEKIRNILKSKPSNKKLPELNLPTEAFIKTITDNAVSNGYEQAKSEVFNIIKNCQENRDSETEALNHIIKYIESTQQ